jgi:diacylglycerol kinase family enzyme
VSADGPMEFHVDGEPGVLRGPVEVTIQPAALKVRCAPAGA